MSPQLAALFTQHKTAILGTAAAGVAGLALLQKKKRAGGVTTTAGASIPGTIPAAAVVPSQATTSTYDSSAYDVYSALQPEIEQLMQTTTAGTPAAAAPAPVASTLFAPSGSTNFVRWGNGAIDQVQNDGSLLWLNPSELAAVTAKSGGNLSYSQMLQDSPANVFNTGYNLTAKSQGGSSVPTA